MRLRKKVEISCGVISGRNADNILMDSEVMRCSINLSFLEDSIHHQLKNC